MTGTPRAAAGTPRPEGRAPSGPRRREILLAFALPAAAGRAVASPADPGDEPVRRGRALVFPRDHGAHLRSTIEWWYVTGELATRPEERFGFQITFFRSRTGLAEALHSRFAARQLLFAHAAITDLGRGTHGHAQRAARWSGDPKAALAAASVADTDVRIGGWSIVRRDDSGLSRWHAAFDAAADTRLDLDLRATQPPLLQGDAGFSRKGPDEAHASHYVSEPQLRVTGRLQRAGRSTEVTGRAWLDHEWSDRLMADDAVGWDWIGMNLDDGGALTAFRLRRPDGRALWAGGSWRSVRGELRIFGADEVRFSPGETWLSPASGARYPIAWQVDTPAGRFEVRALLAAQEVDARTTTGTAYWEGLSDLLDARGRRVGRGYLEMTGYAAPLRLG